MKAVCLKFYHRRHLGRGPLTGLEGAILSRVRCDTHFAISLLEITYQYKVIVDPETGGVLSCIRNRNNSQEPDSETRDRNQEQSEINKSR